MYYTLFLVVFQIATVACRPDGAPVDACENMTPSHGTRPQQNAQSPYMISVDKQNVASGTNVIVTVNATSPTVKYRGILLEARAAGSIIPAGIWGVDSQHKILRCSTQPALTHNNNNDKNLPQTFTWTAPSPAAATAYTIYMTIVQVKKTFYVKLRPKFDVTVSAQVNPVTPQVAVNIHTTPASLTIIVPTASSNSGSMTSNSNAVTTKKPTMGGQAGGSTMKMTTTGGASSIESCFILMLATVFVGIWHGAH